ncbi:hypothetical protein B0F90DRAFT_1668282 [Multifurca ochricompacta]|uniref:BTB domain-containing protein n=1 Tax=Multifurca ochricompacta TaxID=376703 RepID=A0AAD4QNA1_9AGAM|nr:hypothetical protein B0F90DRAFT_1668282 [Multifurca ochricompacta]
MFVQVFGEAMIEFRHDELAPTYFTCSTRACNCESIHERIYARPHGRCHLRRAREADADEDDANDAKRTDSSFHLIFTFARFDSRFWTFAVSLHFLFSLKPHSHSDCNAFRELVENTLFRVHRYFLIRDSAYFRDKLPQPFSPGESSKGSSDRNPLVLDNVLKVEFERLLWVFYNPKYSLYDAGIEEWTSILKLAHDWNFIEVKALAVRELQSLQIPALQKIVLYQTYAIDRNLLQPAYTALITRDEPITTEEGRELTIETALSLARAREIARAPAFSGSGKKPGNPRSPVNLAGVDLDALIKETFQLSSNDAAAERPPTQPTSTGRGTPSSGRDSPHPGTQTTGTVMWLKVREVLSTVSPTVRGTRRMVTAYQMVHRALTLTVHKEDSPSGGVLTDELVPSLTACTEWPSGMW